MAEHLEAAAEVGLALLPAPADEIDRGAVLAAGSRREVAAAEPSRRAVERAAGRCAAAAADCPGRRAPGGRARRGARAVTSRGRQVELVLEPAGEQLGGPLSSRLLPLAAQRFEVAARGQAHRLRVAAEADHAIPPGCEEAVQLDARHAPPGAGRGLARCREQDRRPAELLGEAARGDPHHPLVPAVAPGHEDRRQRRAGGDDLPRLLDGPQLGVLALAVPAARARSASSAARRSSRLSSSSSARSASSSRPAALRRGPRRKPTSAAVNGGLTPDCWIKRLESLRPRARRARAGPRAAITRFSPASGTRSAIVPRQAMRSSGARSTARPQRPARASASLSARPDRGEVRERIGAASPGAG